MDCLKGGVTHAKLADEFGIGTSTIGDNKKDEANIGLFASRTEWM